MFRVFECQVVAITEKLSCGQSSIPPSQEREASKKANSARKAMRLTTMLATNPTAQDAPWDAASNTFLFSLRDKWHLNGYIITLNTLNGILSKKHSVISI